MKKTLLYTLSAFCFVLSVLSSCEDKLDETPDNRTEIDSPEKVLSLLTSGYPDATPALILELSGDNLVDNNVVVPATRNASDYQFYDEAYRWEDIRSYSTNLPDTPYQVWDRYYYGIAVCNHAIEAMEKMAAERGTSPKTDSEFAPAWGEAHVLRAYLHFILINVFAEAYKDEAQSSQDMGLPYVTEPETTVRVDYSDPKYRKSVAEFYDLIEQDILEGINLIDDSRYKVPAYHFNKNAANALAARFYLFKRDYQKCVEYATAALGSNPASSLRKWANMNANTINTLLLAYNDETEPCNFLIQSTESLQDRMLGACRYAINGGTTFDSKEPEKYVPSTQDILMEGGGPNWSGRIPAYDGKIYKWAAGAEYGAWMFNVYEYFEYTNKIAGIGKVHILYHPFSAEETLLCRAEAELYLGQTDAAIADLGYWTSSKQVTAALTQANIDNFYAAGTATRPNIYLSDIHPQEMSSEFPVLGDAEQRVLQCILHFRRIETNFEGLRWFDIKRYGITVHHASKAPQEYDVTHDYLLWNDPRRVLQIPARAINAGYPETNREALMEQKDELSSKPILAK